MLNSPSLTLDLFNGLMYHLCLISFLFSLCKYKTKQAFLPVSYALLFDYVLPVTPAMP